MMVDGLVEKTVGSSAPQMVVDLAERKVEMWDA
jgi:hypothetical protein